jgi:hypothetical protein
MAGSAQRRKVYAQVTEVCLLELEKALRATSIAPESPAKLPKWIRALPASVSSVEAVVGGGKDVAIELSGPARIARGTGGQRTCGVVVVGDDEGVAWSTSRGWSGIT